MLQILLIQSRENPESLKNEVHAYDTALHPHAKLSVRSSLDMDAGWERPEQLLQDIDGILIGGSGDFDIDGGRADDDRGRVLAKEIVERLRPLVDFVIKEKKPLFGVCFGHQLVAELYGGTVTKDASQMKVGTYDVHLTDEGKQDAIFSKLPEHFPVQYVHKDSVTSLPHGATLLATGESCKFSALRYGESVYTTQFHPERDVAGMCACLKPGDGYLPKGVDVRTIVRDSKDASSILGHWITHIGAVA